MKQYIFRTLIIALICTPIYLAIRRPWRFKDKREIALGVFVVYLACLFTFTLEGTYQSPVEMIRIGFQRIQTGEYVNIIPFKTISGFFRDSTADEFWINIISNVVIFVPWGFLLPVLWSKFKKWTAVIPMCLGITVFIEIYQLFIWRNTDIDDVILNFIGGIIGYALFLILHKIVGKSKI